MDLKENMSRDNIITTHTHKKKKEHHTTLYIIQFQTVNE